MNKLTGIFLILMPILLMGFVSATTYTVNINQLSSNSYSITLNGNFIGMVNLTASNTLALIGNSTRSVVAPLDQLDINTTLPCGGAYSNAPHNVLITAPSCKQNLNLTFEPNTTVQTYLNTGSNTLITVNAIPKWNIVFNCTSSFTNSTRTISNSTVNALLICNKEPPLHLTYNITPSNTATITTNAFGKPLSVYGSFINDTVYGIRINAFYPRQDLSLILAPGGGWNNSASNTSIHALNFTDINMTLENQLYYQKYGKSCQDPINVSNTFICLKQYNESPNLATICPEIFLTTKNLSMGEGSCLIHAYNYTEGQIQSQQPYVSTHIHPDDYIANLTTQISDLKKTPNWEPPIIWGVTILFSIGILSWTYIRIRGTRKK